MIRLQPAPTNVHLSDYQLSAVFPSGSDEPRTLPPPIIKPPIRLVSLVEKSQSSLLDLLDKAKQDAANRKKLNEKEKGENVCTECGYAYKSSPGFKKEAWIRHSLLHIAVNQYKCNQNECNFQCREKNDMKEHLCRAHKISERALPPDVTRTRFTKKELDLIDKEARKCFPDWGFNAPPIDSLDFLRKDATKATKQKPKGTCESCELCGEEIFANKRFMYVRQEEHAGEAHSDGFKLWRCNKCSFGSNDRDHIATHFKKEHPEDNFNEDINIKQAGHDERRKHHENSVAKCFPKTTLLRILQ